MAKKVTLMNRKINHKNQDTVAQEKKDILRAMQLQEQNEQASKVGQLIEFPLTIIKTDANQPRTTYINIDSL
ncbi:chromosome partitioning protein ParB, partial [Francisella tularensis subsp. holarctica]|nr:chromosome partitioning protein ParB [Francisella tularensis subsp. holarctica]